MLDQFTASFPYAFCTNTSVSVAGRPALKQLTSRWNFIRCPEILRILSGEWHIESKLDTFHQIAKH
jgi:hypothetical protein